MSITRQNLSIIIVSYKSEHVIENCINSVDNQIEIIIIENSNNEEFKKNIEKKYSNVKCILSPENLGMGAGNNLGIKNIKSDFAFILNPDVNLEKDSLDKIFDASKNINDFGILAPISIKEKYPNYQLEKKTEFDPNKPFRVKSVDGFAMILNLNRLRKIENFEFFDENFFMYLENDDLCKRLIQKNENIYIIPKSKINHLGGEAVNPKYEKEIEYSRNLHWMWSKFYYNKKHYGYLIATTKVLGNFSSAIIKFFYYSITLNKFKRKIYQMRLLGLFNSMIGKKSFIGQNCNISALKFYQALYFVFFFFKISQPPRSNKSITKTKAETFPFDNSINLAAASAVPPVAIKSSIIRTLSFCSIESLCTSIVAVPYSNSKSTE